MKYAVAVAVHAERSWRVGIAQGARSKWVYPDANGRLQYTADARGNRIMDFSHAGYKGGGVRFRTCALRVR